jgi:hypothetical protein
LKGGIDQVRGLIRLVRMGVDRAVSQDENDLTRSIFGTMDHQNGRSLVRMSKWTNPLGLAALIAGIYAALCPIWTLDPVDNKAMITMITLGVITAGLALFDLARPGSVVVEGLIALMGVLFLVSPWVMDFNTGFTTLAWTAWIVGIVALGAGLRDVQVTRSEHSGVVTSR